MSGPASQSLRSIMAQIGTAPPSTVDSIRRKAIQRLQEKLDPAKARFKPISLVRQEARQFVEQFLEAELPMMAKSERDKLLENVLAEAMGFGVLEELFRDDSIREFVVLAPQQIIIHKGERWLPANTHFRDQEHYRSVLMRIYEQGESLLGNSPKVAEPSAFHVRLPNGFRVMAVVPPSILETPPMVVFTRDSASSSGVVQNSATNSRVVPSPIPPQPVIRAEGSAIGSGTVQFNQPRASINGSSSSASSISGRMVDPFERAKHRITEKIINRMAAVGAYDLSRVPINELQRVIALYVSEFSQAEGMGLEAPDEQRLTREILNTLRRS